MNEVTGVFSADGSSRLMEVSYIGPSIPVDGELKEIPAEAIWSHIGHEVGKLILAVEKETGRPLKSVSVAVQGRLKRPDIGHLTVNFPSR